MNNKQLNKVYIFINRLKSTTKFVDFYDIIRDQMRNDSSVVYGTQKIPINEADTDLYKAIDLAAHSIRYSGDTIDINDMEGVSNRGFSQIAYNAFKTRAEVQTITINGTKAAGLNLDV